jgi:hypothetical protein
MTQPFVRIVGHAFRESKNLPSVGAGRSAMVAFFSGIVLGPFGVGLYLRSWIDFTVLLGLLILGSFMTVGVGAPVFWLLCGAWGAVRVNHANKALTSP